MNLSYNNRWVRLFKDALFVAVCVWLVVRGGTFAKVLGILAGFWYGRDLYFQAKVLWQEKHFVPKSRREESTPADESKIQVTDLSGAKEVDFEKE